MRKNQDIDELLNAFIDKELTPRQLTELRRLLANNPDIAKRLKELEKCKMLVNSLPAAKAPEEMLKNIKACLERRALLAQPVSDLIDQQGQKELMFRKLMTAAAMFGLVAVLAVVIYTIVKPAPDVHQSLTFQTSQPPPAIPVSTTAEQKTFHIETGFTAKLELKTQLPADIKESLIKAAKQNNLSDNLRAIEAKQNVLILNCSKKAMAAFLVDLNNLWSRLDSARLFVHCPRTDKELVVDWATPQQIVEIANQDTEKKRIEMAKTCIALNNVLIPPLEQNHPGSLLLSNAIPEPILTSPAEPGKSRLRKTAPQQDVTLTIVLLDANDKN